MPECIMTKIVVLIPNKIELDRIAERRGKDISRKIRPMVLTIKELRSLWEQLNMDHALLIWGAPISKE